MLGKLRIPKSALFLTPKKKIVARKVIAEALNNCSSHRSGRPHASVVREAHHIESRTVQVSYTIFKISREPSFLLDSGLKDLLYGFVVIVEVGEICAVFSSHAQDPWRHLNKSYNKLEHPVLTRLFVSEHTAYESLTTENMSISRHSIRSRRVEAEDLRESLSLTGAGNSVPNSLRLRQDENVFRIASRTSRVAKRDPSAALDDIVRFCASVDEQIALPRPSGLFIDNFSEPVSLESLPRSVVPTGILIPMSEIGRKLDDGEILSISCGRLKDERVLLSASSRSRLVNVLSKPMEVREVDSQFRMFQERLGGGDYRATSSGRIVFNPKTITIRGGIFSVLWLEMENGDVQKLESYLNREKNFIITFSDVIHVYYNDRLFKNRAILASADFLLSVIVGEPALAGVKSEKGEIVSGQSSFEADSLFSVTETHICAADPVVICDDLGEEWADYIAVNDSSSPPHMSFYHCKHASLGLSASAFHVVVSQALKNLGTLSGNGSSFSRKIKGLWSKCYTAEKTKTKIARLRRGTSGDAETQITAALSSANCARRMVLVVSFLSRQRLKDEVENIRAGRAVSAQIAQLLWLLMSFVGTCREASVEPKIVSLP